MKDREQKARATRRPRDVDHAANAFVLDFKGISVPQVAELRKQIRDSGSDYVVVKNTLALIAFPLESPARVERQMLRLKFIAILKHILRQRSQMHEQMQQLIAAMMPAATVPLPPYVLQARRNAVARDALLREFGAMTSAQVGENAGSQSPNRASLAHRWKSDRRIFAVSHQGSQYFPGFQFTNEGQPLGVIGDVLGVLGAKLAPWELALWFTRNNGWLAGRRPVDLLLEDPGSVVTAAEREAEERVF
jgi:hypothetical protein